MGLALTGIVGATSGVANLGGRHAASNNPRPRISERNIFTMHDSTMQNSSSIWMIIYNN
jgi:hypothetical protein